MWKIRSSVARSFSDYIEDPTSLTRPSSLGKGNSGPILSPISSQNNPFARK